MIVSIPDLCTLAYFDPSILVLYLCKFVLKFDLWFSMYSAGPL